MDVSIIKKKESVLESMNINNEPEDWKSPIKKPFTTDYTEQKSKYLKEYTLLGGKFDKRLPGEVLARCLGKEESNEQLKMMHGEICCIDHVVGLYR